ncbi:ROK family protein [Halorarius halobius]|uniref:ROK family protein n=1 Tax=Halorarius halobius TaxID=2962671 RepID=UPI0020CF6029|nr:ROK family protein [Halorarius halobius]
MSGEPRYAGIDVGATNTRAVVANATGEVRGRARDRTTRVSDGDRVAEEVVGVLREACGGAGVGPDDLKAVGIGAIGPQDDRGGVVDPPNHPADRIPLVAAVEAATGASVRLRNDAVAGVIAERRFADAPDNAVYLTLSSGVGAGVVVDGHVLTGSGGNAAEVGHITVDSTGAVACGCGGRGHWEAYAAGTNLPAYARHVHGEGVETDLDLGEVTAPDLFAAPDDPLAAEVLDRLARWNTLGAAALVHAYAPDLVSVGGAVACNNPAAVVDPVRERLPDHVVTSVPEVRVTPLGDEVVVRGALALALPE